jgi:NAD(P)-dependent dehydrogenase (short-subunit alcohol dehydrogenase family)
VTREADCERIAAEVHRTHERLDVLMNNAGVGHVGTMLTTTGADLDRVFAVNVRGVFNVTRVFLPGMVERGRGSIIHMASTTGIVGVRDRLAYGMSKHAVVGLTKSMALDHAKTGVRINCICPGRIETPFMLARIQDYPDPKAAYREMSDTQAIGRMGRPEEIAQVALFLASDDSSFMTGSAVVADGGWTAGR